MVVVTSKRDLFVLFTFYWINRPSNVSFAFFFFVVSILSQSLLSDVFDIRCNSFRVLNSPEKKSGDFNPC